MRSGRRRFVRAGGGALALGALRWPQLAGAQGSAVPGTLRVALSIAETSFDPAFASDAASDGIIANVFDTMLE